MSHKCVNYELYRASESNPKSVKVTNTTKKILCGNEIKLKFRIRIIPT
jgi:hypothetical protein